jgi:phenylacetic acid degradation operon negative regulatory protein
MTPVKTLQSAEASKSRTTIDIGLPSTPANSFLTDISALFVRDTGNWLPVGTWVALLGALDVTEATARSALHRYVKAGYLASETRDARTGYSMSQTWLNLMDELNEDADLMDEAAETDEPPEAAWTLVTFSVPEERRDIRHAIRAMLGRNGFASLGNGVWIGSGARLNDMRVAIKHGGYASHIDVFTADYAGFTDVSELVRRCWDIDSIADMYRDLIGQLRTQLKQPAKPDARTFVSLVRSHNTWRRINFADPQLSADVLPPDWPRAQAKESMRKLLTRFLEPARGYVASLTP